MQCSEGLSQALQKNQGKEVVWWLAELACDQKVQGSIPETSEYFTREPAV